jgi:signal transduction histidine kinase
MSEQKTIRSLARLVDQFYHAYADRFSLQRDLHLFGPAQEEKKTQPLGSSYPHIGGNQPHNTPPWLRPFFSLRIQLTFAYALLLILMVAFSYLFLYQQQASSTYVMLVVLGMVVVGSALTYLMTSLLLRPLFRVTDAAQAIAMGDLEQRERLPLRLPPQDEIDRLAGSINAMVTRLETAEEQQMASQDRFHQFFSDASHQLRTPLTSIRGFTDLLMRGAKDDPETSQRLLQRMKNESERMTLLINDLLTLARLDDTHPMKMQYVDLIDLAVENIEQTKARADDERPIRLQLTVSDKLGVQANKERMKQLLFILLDNALKYGRPAPDGQITLKLAKQQNQVTLSVIDNGDGIAHDDLGHIFEAFYRGRHRSSSNSTSIIGTGLGLTIASSIVRAHNGAITVDSESGNTEFKVLLPSAD